jgi:hypothetical protein
MQPPTAIDDRPPRARRTAFRTGLVEELHLVVAAAVRRSADDAGSVVAFGLTPVAAGRGKRGDGASTARSRLASGASVVDPSARRRDAGSWLTTRS